MNISNSQVNRLRHFVRAGLRSLFRPEPQTAVEWADANYYLPKESAYQEGRWETLPFQRAIMNAMGSDYIREVNVVKSARVGYSKMLLGVYAYFIEHKQRNTLIWLPTDGDAENFMKTHVEPTIRDIPSLLALAPWYGKKHRDNTLTMKRFTNGRGFWCLGGKAAKNYREKSVDVAGYDELAAFDDDIEQEGSPTFLGDKRIEGSVWPKSIRGSTPKVRGTCQIERAASESPHFMRFHVACPHCGEEQWPELMNLLVKVMHIFRLIQVCQQTVPTLHRQIFQLASWLFSTVMSHRGISLKIIGEKPSMTWLPATRYLFLNSVRYRKMLPGYRRKGSFRSGTAQPG